MKQQILAYFSASNKSVVPTNNGNMLTRSIGLIHGLIHTLIFRWMCSHGFKKSFETICLYKHNYLQNYHNIYHY